MSGRAAVYYNKVYTQGGFHRDGLRLAGPPERGDDKGLLAGFEDEAGKKVTSNLQDFDYFRLNGNHRMKME